MCDNAKSRIDTATVARREKLQTQLREEANRLRGRAIKFEEAALKLDQYGPEVEELIDSIRNMF